MCEQNVQCHPFNTFLEPLADSCSHGFPLRLCYTVVKTLLRNLHLQNSVDVTDRFFV